jgi:hypothetical protein
MEVLPWLARRMEENKGVMQGASRDKLMLRSHHRVHIGVE